MAPTTREAAQCAAEASKSRLHFFPRQFEEAKDTMLGMGAALAGIPAFFETSAKYITGADRVQGENRSWTKIGTQLCAPWRFSETCNPVFRVADVALKIPGGVADMASLHGAYEVLHAVGVGEGVLAMFGMSAPPADAWDTTEGRVRELTNAGIVWFMPAVARRGRAALGLPEKAPPLHDGPVVRELAAGLHRHALDKWMAAPERGAVLGGFSAEGAARAQLAEEVRLYIAERQKKIDSMLNGGKPPPTQYSVADLLHDIGPDLVPGFLQELKTPDRIAQAEALYALKPYLGREDVRAAVRALANAQKGVISRLAEIELAECDTPGAPAPVMPEAPLDTALYHLDGNRVNLQERRNLMNNALSDDGRIMVDAINRLGSEYLVVADKVRFVTFVDPDVLNVFREVARSEDGAGRIAYYFLDKIERAGNQERPAPRVVANPLIHHIEELLWSLASLIRPTLLADIKNCDTGVRRLTVDGLGRYALDMDSCYRNVPLWDEKVRAALESATRDPDEGVRLLAALQLDLGDIKIDNAPPHRIPIRTGVGLDCPHTRVVVELLGIPFRSEQAVIRDIAQVRGRGLEILERCRGDAQFRNELLAGLRQLLKDDEGLYAVVYERLPKRLHSTIESVRAENHYAEDIQDAIRRVEGT